MRQSTFVKSVLCALLPIICHCNHLFDSSSPDCADKNTQSTISSGSEKVTISQGIWGDIRYWTGDFMPKVSSTQDPCSSSSGRIYNVKREVFIFPTINPFTSPSSVQLDVAGLPFILQINATPVLTVWSDDNGFFQATLPAGSYSVLPKDTFNGKTFYYASRYDIAGNIQTANITTGKTAQIILNIYFNATH